MDFYQWDNFCHPMELGNVEFGEWPRCECGHINGAPVLTSKVKGKMLTPHDFPDVLLQSGSLFVVSERFRDLWMESDLQGANFEAAQLTNRTKPKPKLFWFTPGRFNSIDIDAERSSALFKRPKCNSCGSRGGLARAIGIFPIQDTLPDADVFQSWFQTTTTVTERFRDWVEHHQITNVNLVPLDNVTEHIPADIWKLYGVERDDGEDHEKTDKEFADRILALNPIAEGTSVWDNVDAEADGLSACPKQVQLRARTTLRRLPARTEQMEIVGVYPVTKRGANAHLVEVVVRDCEFPFDPERGIEQPSNTGFRDSQVPWLLEFLNEDGSAIGFFNWRGNVRFCFYLHFLNANPLLTPFGLVSLPAESPKPERMDFMKFRRVD